MMSAFLFLSELSNPFISDMTKTDSDLRTGLLRTDSKERFVHASDITTHNSTDKNRKEWMFLVSLLICCREIRKTTYNT